MNFSFTEARRRRLGKKVDRLERLETRNTITEPISITSLAVSAMKGAASLGFILFPTRPAMPSAACCGPPMGRGKLVARPRTRLS